MYPFHRLLSKHYYTLNFDTTHLAIEQLLFFKPQDAKYPKLPKKLWRRQKKWRRCPKFRTLGIYSLVKKSCPVPNGQFRNFLSEGQKSKSIGQLGHFQDYLYIYLVLHGFHRLKSPSSRERYGDRYCMVLIKIYILFTCHKGIKFTVPEIEH